MLMKLNFNLGTNLFDTQHNSNLNKIYLYLLNVNTINY